MAATSSPSARSVLIVTTAIQVLTALAAVSVPVFAPAAAREVSVSPALIGWFVGMMYIGASFAALVCGGIIERYGPIRVSQVGLLLCGAALALITLIRPGQLLPWIPLTALLLGAGYGPITPASSTILARTTPPHLMALTFSLKQTGVPIGAALAGLIVPLITLTSGWRAAALTVAAACALMALLAQPMRAALDAERRSNAGSLFSLRSLKNAITAPLVIIFSDRALTRGSLTSASFAGLQMCFFTYIVAYLTESLAYTLVAAGLALSCANLGGIIGRILWGWVADRTRKPTTVLALLGFAMTLAAWATASFSNAWPVLLIYAVCAVFGLTAVGWNGVQISEITRLSPPGKTSLVAGGSTFITFFAVVFFPPLFAVLHDLLASYRPPFVLFAIPALLMGVLQWRARRS